MLVCFVLAYPSSHSLCCHPVCLSFQSTCLSYFPIHWPVIHLKIYSFFLAFILTNLCCCSCEQSCLSKAACLSVRPACATCPACQAVVPACQFFHISFSLSHLGHTLALESRSIPPVLAFRHHTSGTGMGSPYSGAGFLRNRLRDMASQEQRMAGWASYGAQRKLAGLDVLGATRWLAFG